MKNRKDSCNDICESLLDNSKALLETVIESGMLSVDDISELWMKKRKERILEKHDHEIWQGTGNDKRWFTYVADDLKPKGRRKIAKISEEDLYDYLEDFYFGEGSRGGACLLDVYPKWLEYKIKTSRRPNTPRRMDADWKKYYVNEPLSQELIHKPITDFTRALLREWAISIIKKYNLTKKAYGNLATVIRQILQYLVDCDLLDKNIMCDIHIEGTFFFRPPRKKAKTQVFYKDEVRLICERAEEKAIESNDENFLAIPLALNTGLRPQEVLALYFSDFSRDSHSIYVHRSLALDTQYDKKSNSWSTYSYSIMDFLKQNAEPRDVLVTEECYRIKQLILRILGSKHIFRQNLFDVETPATLGLKLYRLCDELGIMRRSAHKMRKTYVSTCLNKGIDPDFVREQVGHSDLQTTFNYYTFSTTRDEDKLKELEKIYEII